MRLPKHLADLTEDQLDKILRAVLEDGVEKGLVEASVGRDGVERFRIVEDAPHEVGCDVSPRPVVRHRGDCA